MNDRSKRHLLLILFLTTLYISTSCCVDEPVDEEVISNVQLGGEEIVSNMKMNDLEDYSYKMYVNSSSGEKSPEIYEIMWKRPDFMKTTILNPDKYMKVIMASDGDFQWIYSSESNTVFKTEFSDDFDGLKLFEPNVYAEFLNGTLNERSLSLIGIENVDGKNTYLLELTPLDTNNEPLQWKSKIWVDRENWMLLRSELYDSRENVNLSMEIRDMKLNSGIPDSEFEFKIPDGAQVKVLGPEDFKSEPKKLMLEEAKELIDFAILTPEYLPEGYEFNYSMVSSSMDTPYSTFVHSRFSVFAGQPYEKIILVYTKGDNEIRIVESISEKVYPETQGFENEGEYIQVNNINGTIFPIFGGNMKALTWQNEEIEITIISSFDKIELLNIAESLS
ncbi:MAG: outer membrane lipoprotein-sorting protein [Methanosarcina sp.]|jgi:outer membrane lipoprotein-sorting protein|nr:outer membrane lipoprotein-sorting protein [Methanosarcina sp.]MDD3318330.1 outer membrane lipoprotein-sorting protein [Methanosarcina sp.]MDD4304896.1 outer membrane lipoprotein-sorting protein [Methanosarcina sp.]MDD4619764.1 outer membrane lipoprotein-sorting protein [Methanosarcina sp.]NLN42990.1 outer membrane lipoprotein-sorting protein [Methanosarcina sp.]